MTDKKNRCPVCNKTGCKMLQFGRAWKDLEAKVDEAVSELEAQTVKKTKTTKTDKPKNG